MSNSSSEEDFEEFKTLQPYSMRKGIPLTVWRSYRDWLRLMVHYFDAADILATYVKELKGSQPNPEISITIITPPHPDKKMLSFTELLESERFFPRVPNEPTGRELAEYFKTTPDAVDCSNKKGPTFHDQFMKGSRATFSGTNHCEAYIASLLAFEGSDERIEKLTEGLSCLTRQDIKKMLALIKASHFSCIT